MNQPAKAENILRRSGVKSIAVNNAFWINTLNYAPPCRISDVQIWIKSEHHQICTIKQPDLLQSCTIQELANLLCAFKGRVVTYVPTNERLQWNLNDGAGLNVSAMKEQCPHYRR